MYRMFNEYKSKALPDLRAANSATDKCDKCHELKQAMAALRKLSVVVAAPWLDEYQQVCGNEAEVGQRKVC